MAKKILSKKQITELAKRVAIEAGKDNFPISDVFLFGSYAKNKAKEDSDLDVCFVSDKFKNSIEAEAYLRTKVFFLFKYDTPIDVVAFRPSEFKLNSPLALEIRNTGIKIV